MLSCIQYAVVTWGSDIFGFIRELFCLEAFGIVGVFTVVFVLSRYVDDWVHQWFYDAELHLNTRMSPDWMVKFGKKGIKVSNVLTILVTVFCVWVWD